MVAPLLALAIPSIIEAAKDLIDRYVPDKTAAAAAKAALDRQEATEHFQIKMANIALNTAETSNGSWLGKWRGFLGWTCAVSAAYQLMLQPLMIAVILWITPTFPVEKLPKLEWAQLGQLLMGMLGM